MKRADFAFMQAFDIHKDGDLYLHRRRVIQTPWFAVYLHRIYLEDRDRHLHDHPWNFAAWVLRGGYVETFQQHLGLEREQRVQRWGRWSWHRMARSAGHQITSVQPGTVTLVFCGRHAQTWGFWVDGEVVPYHEYLKAGEVS